MAFRRSQPQRLANHKQPNASAVIVLSIVRLWAENAIADLTSRIDDVDYKSDGGRWRSQSLSDALSPQQRDAVRQTFQKAFDLYKSGDFTAAKALVEKGLRIDPANYLAWFTLGNIERSAYTTQNDVDAWGQAWFAYNRVLDLAPAESDEATLAQGYLKTGMH